MTKSTLIALVILLLISGFIIAPFLLPDDGSGNAAEYDGGDGLDLDFHKSKSARTSGGSRSFRGGK